MSAKMQLFRINPLIAGIAVSLVLLSLGAIVALMKGLPGVQQQEQGEAAPATDGGTARSAKASSCAICGTVESIRILEVRVEADETGTDSSRPSDAMAGGRSSRGEGSSSVTLLGVTGGVFGGSDAENSVRKRNAYRVTVRMDDGSYRTLSLSSPPAFAVGDKVRVVEGKLVRA